MTGAHYFLAASFAGVWEPCPGAAQMAAMHPTEESEDMREGTASDWYAVQRVLGVPGPHPKAPNGVILTDEMMQAATVWTNDMRDVVAAAGPGCVWRVQHKGQATDIHPEHCGGTTDAFVWDPTKRRLTVWDYKYGFKEVSEFENRQLVVYVSMLLGEFGIDGHAEQSVTVDMRICQPRCYTARSAVRSWVVPATDLRPLYNKLRASAAEAMGPSPRTISGPHCYYCPARHVCEASRRATYACVEYIGKAVPEPLTPDAVSFELNLLERAEEAIKGRLTAMRAQGEALVKSGKVVPGYGVETTWGRLTWNQPVEAVKMLGQAYGMSLVEEKLITPTQAKNAGIDESVIKAYAERPKGLAFKRVNTDDIRRVLGTNN